MKAACRRRWCVACTSSPTATSSTTRPMCLAFGLPGVGKSHAMCAVGHALVDRGHAVLFMPTYSLVQELLAAKRNLELPRALRKLDHFAVLILDDVGLHPAESRGGRDSLHAARRTLRATLGLHHEQSDLRAVGSDLPRSDGDGRGDRSPGASLGAAGVRCPQLPDRARETPRQGHAPSGRRPDTMNRAPADRSCDCARRHSRISAGASAPAGAPALTSLTATNRPTTTTECRQVVGDTPLLTLRPAEIVVATGKSS